MGLSVATVLRFSKIGHLPPGRKVVSSDSHIVKMWDQQTGVNFTNIEPPETGINDICLWKDSGLVMLACDAPKIQVRLTALPALWSGWG